MNFRVKLVLRTVLPLVVYLIMYLASKAFKRNNKPWQADALIDGIFFIVFLIYPSTASKLFSVLICQDLEDGTGRMRVDFSLQCADEHGFYTGEYIALIAFTTAMLLVHTVGTPLLYAYLFFVQYKPQLTALEQQELADFHKDKLDSNKHMKDSEKEVLAQFGLEDRVTAKETMPGYMRKLTAGYEYRTYWFEIFESIRKVLLVGIPAMFPDRGGNAQLVWGLMVCFITFGMYMMYAPFIADSDDQLQQLCQAQIFITLVASIGLRMDPPDETLATIISVVLFFIPFFAIAMETPIVAEMSAGMQMLRKLLGKILPRKRFVSVKPEQVYTSKTATTTSGDAANASQTPIAWEGQDGDEK